MEKYDYHSPVSSEKCKKSSVLYEKNEVTEEVDFQYVSLKKMNYVHWRVRRKIQKEKEQQMWLDYARRLPEFQETFEELTADVNEIKHIEKKCYTAKCQQIAVDKRSGTCVGSTVQHRSCQTVGKSQYQNHSQIPKPNAYTQRKPQKKEATKDIQSHVHGEITHVSPRVQFGNDKQHSQSILKSSGIVPVSSFEKLKFRTRPSSKKNKISPVLLTDNSSKPKSSNKSYAFSSLCSHIWQKLLINEEDEKRLFLHLQEINKEQSHKAEVKNVAIEPKPITSMPRKPIINKPVMKPLQKPTLLQEPTLKSSYDICDKSVLVKRLSDTIVIDLLNQVCKEFNNLSEIFLCELFEKEFQLSNLISK